MSISARLAGGVLVVCAALFQVAIAYRMEVEGAYPHVLVLVVASLALLTNSVAGATYGFVAGVAIATFAALPLGTHALLLVLIGYTIGRVGEQLTSDNHPLPPLVAGVLATIFLQIGRPLVEFIVNPAVLQIDGFVIRAFMMAIISSVLAVPIYLAVRGILAWVDRNVMSSGVEQTR